MCHYKLLLKLFLWNNEQSRWIQIMYLLHATFEGTTGQGGESHGHKWHSWQAWCSLDGQILTTFCFSSYKMWTIVFFPPSPKVHHTRVSWHIHWEEKWSQERVCVTFAHELLDSLNHKGSGFRKLLSHSRVLHFLLDPMGLFVFGYSPFQPHHFPAP